MSEPRAVASAVEEVVPGVWHWAIQDERIGGFISAAHAVKAGDGAVLIDPLPLEPASLEGFGPVAAICLTSGSHERSAWRYRRELGAPVYAPAGVKEVEEEPDVRYSEGDALPGGLRPFFVPGPGTTQHALIRAGAPTAVFTGDLFVRPPGGDLGLVPEEFLHDPEETRRSVRRLLDLDFDVLCVGHGTPIVDNARAAVQELLERGA